MCEFQSTLTFRWWLSLCTYQMYFATTVFIIKHLYLYSNLNILTHTSVLWNSVFDCDNVHPSGKLSLFLYLCTRTHKCITSVLLRIGSGLMTVIHQGQVEAPAALSTNPPKHSTISSNYFFSKSIQSNTNPSKHCILHQSLSEYTLVSTIISSKINYWGTTRFDS